jgi:hypothetical protein
MGESLMNAVAADVFACTSSGRLSLLDSTNRPDARPTAPNECVCGRADFRLRGMVELNQRGRRPHGYSHRRGARP